MGSKPTVVVKERAETWPEGIPVRQEGFSYPFLKKNEV